MEEKKESGGAESCKTEKGYVVMSTGQTWIGFDLNQALARCRELSDKGYPVTGFSADVFWNTAEDKSKQPSVNDLADQMMKGFFGGAKDGEKR